MCESVNVCECVSEYTLCCALMLLLCSADLATLVAMLLLPAIETAGDGCGGAGLERSFVWGAP